MASSKLTPDQLALMIPTLMQRGLLLVRAEAPDDVHDIVAAQGHTTLQLRGAGTITFSLHEGAIAIDSAEHPAGTTTHLAVEADAANLILELAQTVLASDSSLPAIDLTHPTDAMARGFAKMFSHRAQQIAAPFALQGRVLVKGVPLDAGERDVEIDFSLNLPELAATPTFTVQVHYDDLDDVRHGELTRDQLIGRVRIRGDASRAMQLAVKLSDLHQVSGK